MSRISRKDLGTPFLHVMVQGVNKEYIFYNNQHIEKYLNLIEKNKCNYEFTIIAYCIMNNHAHFLVHTENIEEFGEFMHKVNMIYAQFYNKEQGRCGALFRNRYKTEPIYHKKYLINCIKYIHNNPLKAGMVNKSEEYKYSSCNNYLRNIGESKCRIMEKLFGKECNYNELFQKSYARRFIDVEENMEFLDECIEDGVREFISISKIKLYEILSDRDTLKELIYFLKENCKIKYVEIRNYFEISRGIMETLKTK